MTRYPLFSARLSFTCCAGMAEAPAVLPVVTLPCLLTPSFAGAHLSLPGAAKDPPLRVSHCLISAPHVAPRWHIQTLQCQIMRVSVENYPSRPKNQSKILILRPSQLGFSTDPSSTFGKAYPNPPPESVERPKAVPFLFPVPPTISFWQELPTLTCY